MKTNAKTIFSEVKKGQWQPVYLIIGSEPFQMEEICQAVKKHFVKDESAESFNFERFDGKGLDAGDLLASLETLPGLFSDAGDQRLIFCKEIDQAGDSTLKQLEPYFGAPVDSTCLLMTATKVNKRKTWYKAIEKAGYVVEVNEPYERDWPKWQTYLSKKCGKQVSPEAWHALVEFCDNKLSIVWSELQKIATFVGERESIEFADIQACSANLSVENVFLFTEDVLCKRKTPAMKRYFELIEGGENEIKILALLSKQFRSLWQCLVLKKQGVDDTKQIASELGAHPFFVTKLLKQSKFHNLSSLKRSLRLLSDCDVSLKTGKGSLFDGFLAPYFNS